MYKISVQRAVSHSFTPKNTDFKKWVHAALLNNTFSVEIHFRIVNKEEMTHLNFTYRKKNKPTNVLSFPLPITAEFNNGIAFLGDIIICAEIIKEEAKEQKKSMNAHWAHMVVHGTLHLLGFDHENDQDAEVMETHEIQILKSLGFENPYHEEAKHE